MLSAKYFSPYFRGVINVEGGRSVQGVGFCCKSPAPLTGGRSYRVLRVVSSTGRLKTKTKQSQLRAERWYSLCCPPRQPPGECGCPPYVPGGGRRIVPPPDCRPGPIPPNPCCPRFHHGKDSHKKYKYIFLFFCLPVIVFQMFNIWGLEHPHKGPCREYEYMRRRTKRYPWGNGQETFFHNPHVNHLPEECEPPPLICDDD